MGVLDNPRHELFAQGIAKGQSQREAYKAAGYETANDATTDANASRLLSDARVMLRVAELQEIAAKHTGITIERIAVELSKIAFADIRKAVNWGKSPIDKTADHADPNGLRIYPLEMVPSELMDDDTAAAVSEVSLTQGGIKIKMHDKKAALVDLGKHLGMFKEVHEHTGKDGGPIEMKDVTPLETARRLAFLLRAGAESKAE